MTVFYCLPRRLDPHQAATVAERTRGLYEKEFGEFVAWTVRYNLNPRTSEDIDGQLVEYKNAVILPKHRFIYLIASVEFHIPALKKRLPWAHRVADGYEAANPTQHTVPTTTNLAAYYGAVESAAGRPSLGFGHMLQQATGFRPSELLKLKKRHVITPEYAQGSFLFRLGAEVGTKVKREQAAKLCPKVHPDIAAILEILLSVLDDLVPYSYSSYNESLHSFAQGLGLKFKITPRSARAGFATEAVARGDDIATVRNQGRQQSEASSKVYVDQITAALVAVSVSISHKREAMLFCKASAARYFTQHAFQVERSHGSSRVRSRSAEPRQVRASRDGVPKRRQAKKDDSYSYVADSLADSSAKGKGRTPNRRATSRRAQAKGAAGKLSQKLKG